MSEDSNAISIGEARDRMRSAEEEIARILTQFYNDTGLFVDNIQVGRMFKGKPREVPPTYGVHLGVDVRDAYPPDRKEPTNAA